MTKTCFLNFILWPDRNCLTISFITVSQNHRGWKGHQEIIESNPFHPNKTTVAMSTLCRCKNICLHIELGGDVTTLFEVFLIVINHTFSSLSSYSLIASWNALIKFRQIRCTAFLICERKELRRMKVQRLLQI